MFSEKENKYYLVPPRDSYTWLFEPFALGNGAVPFNGYNQTGHSVKL